MTEFDERYFALALHRLKKAMFAIGAGGAILAWAWRGWTWGGGFALGALISWLNFRWLHQIVEALSGKGVRKRLALVAGARYLLLGGVTYAILSFSKISRPATLAGLFLSAAAVIVEIVIELLYARN